MTHARYSPATARHARDAAGPAVTRRTDGRPAVPRPPATPLRYPASVTLIATGTILLCAVSLNTRYLDLNIAGLILLATGLAGIRVPQRAWRWARAHSGGLRSALEQVTAVPEPEAQRVPLDSLLRPVASEDSGTGQAWPRGSPQ